MTQPEVRKRHGHSEGRLPEGLMDNANFHIELIRSLRTIIADKPHLDILDYGAGTQNVSFFSYLHEGGSQAVIAYDPYLPLHQAGERNGALWQKDTPTAKMDLVIFNFSLHHIAQEHPEATISEVIAQNQPQWIAVVEYDYKGEHATLEEFEKTFISEQEKKELAEVFNGDIDACFRFHTQRGRVEYEETLTQAGLTVIARGRGKKTAKFKHFVIAASGDFANTLTRLPSGS